MHPNAYRMLGWFAAPPLEMRLTIADWLYYNGPGNPFNVRVALCGEFVAREGE